MCCSAPTTPTTWATKTPPACSRRWAWRPPTRRWCSAAMLRACSTWRSPQRPLDPRNADARLDMSPLFSRHALGPVELHNRIVVSPMCQYVAEDGAAGDWHLQHLSQLAMSGAGL